MYLLDTNWLSLLSSDVAISLLSSGATLLGSFIFLRERVVKMEVRNQHVMEYIDNQVLIINSHLTNIKEDVEDFKALNKETAKSLAENTTAIRELKLVLELLREQINGNNNNNNFKKYN